MLELDLMNDCGALSLIFHPRTVMMRRNNTSRGPRRKNNAAQMGASLLLLGVAVFQLHSSSTATSPLRRRMLAELESTRPTSSEGTEQKRKRARPRMYTFYNHVLADVEKSTDQETLDVWKEEWTRAGFDARILTLKDATAHPNFNSYKQTLQDSVALHRPIGYNSMCFYRWLAMATVGGGFMSDYDTLPLQGSYDLATDILDGSTDELPNDGKFTVYDEHIPSLMAGSAEEWDRLSSRLWGAAIAQSSGEEEIVGGSDKTSDMLALLAVLRRGTGQGRKRFGEDAAVVVETDMVLSAHLNEFDELNEEKCTKLRGLPAVHFSHAALHRDYNAHDVIQRPEIMRKWSENWRGICGSTRSSNDAKDDENSGEDKEEDHDSQLLRQDASESSTLRLHNTGTGRSIADNEEGAPVG